jgi:NAD(P) transhydrogenase
MEDRYDFIAIGAGPAGESAAELASFLGYRSAIVERDRPGGTVTTTGGAPTKTLREAALYVSGLREGDIYGLRSSAAPEIVTDLIRKRTLDVCQVLQEVTAQNIANNKVDLIQGQARFDRDGGIRVTDNDGEDRKLHARAILIATGSRPFRPPSISFDIPGVCDTDTILQRGRVPADIVIIGGGPVGVEFVTICHALGAKVTLVDRGSRLLTMMDREISDRMTDLLTQWGVAISFGTTAESITSKGDELEVRLSSGEILSPDTALFAAGRVANTDELNLEALGIARDARGRILVDEAFRTSAEGVYAAGDVLGPTLASIAMEQGRAAVCHAFQIPFEGTVDPTPVSAVYGMPEVAGAGLTEEQCREKGLDYATGYADLARTPRGAIAGRGGLLKLIFLKRDRKLIGVHCMGDLASEIVGIGQMAIRCGATMSTIMNMSMNTPTYAYAYKYAAFDGLSRAPAVTRTSRRRAPGAKERRSAHVE